MSGNGSTYKRCGCTEPETGRQLGAACPDLRKRHHGTWCYEIRVDATGGRRKLKRSGFGRESEARAVLGQIGDLVKLAGDDAVARQKIGDMIAEKSSRGGQLPAVEDIRRRLGLRRELGAGETFGEAWAAWLAGRRKARDSYLNTLEQHGRNWLLPVLADIPLERLTGEHCVMVFARVDMFNEEIEAAREEKRAPVLPGDVRGRKKHTGIATQHRIYGVLRKFLNDQWKKAHKIPFNPVYTVDLEAETRAPALVWTPAQVAHFLDFTAGDRLAMLWRFLLLRGFRRGELCGMGDVDVDAAAAAVTVNVALIQVRGRLVWGKPKSKAGERVVGLDRGTVEGIHAHRTLRKRERLAAGEAWEDSGQFFTDELGQALHPEFVSRRFRELAAEAGLPVIKLHAGRHTAATLALEAGVDVKIVAEQLGHSTTRITQDLYQHVRLQLHHDSAEKIVALLPEVIKRAAAGQP